MKTVQVRRLLAAIGVTVVGTAAMSLSAYAAPNSWVPKVVTGITATDFLFGEGCPTNVDGAVTSCFAEADTSDGTTVNANGLEIYRSLLTPGTGDPVNWSAVNTGTGIGNAISCVDPGSTATPNIHCYSVGSGGNLVQCRGLDFQSSSTAGKCDATAWDTKVLTNRANQPADLYAVSCSDKDHCIAVGADGTVLSTVDASAGAGQSGQSKSTWTDIGPSVKGMFLFAAVCPDTTTCYAGGATVTPGGYNPVLLQVKPAGTPTFNLVPTATFTTAGSINGLACEKFNAIGTDCFAAADNNILRGSLTSWNPTAAPGGGLGIACSNGSFGKDCSAGGYSGRILSTTDGTNWVADTTTPASNAEFDATTCFRNGVIATPDAAFCHVLGRAPAGPGAGPVIYGRAATSPTAAAPTSGGVAGASTTKASGRTASSGPATKVRANAAAAAPTVAPRLPRAGHVSSPTPQPNVLLVALGIGFAVTLTGGVALVRRGRR